jgi:uncharacterized membrane protein (DUF485 family)
MSEKQDRSLRQILVVASVVLFIVLVIVIAFVSWLSNRLSDLH